ETIATRIKDPNALEIALNSKIDAEAEFAATYMQLFPPHTGGKEVVASTGHHLSREDWCLSYGFKGRTVRRWCSLCDPVTRDAKKAAIRKRCWELAELWQSASYSSESNEWYTPPKYIVAVHEVHGGVDLDPASSTQANETVRAKQIFTRSDD